MEPGRTGPEGVGVGEPEWSQAGQDPEGEEGKSRVSPREQGAAADFECTPEGARGAGQGSSSSIRERPTQQQRQQQLQSKPASDERVGKGVRRVSSSFASLKQALVCILGRGISVK